MSYEVTLREWFTNFRKETNEIVTHVQFWAASKWDWDWITKSEPWMAEERDTFPTPSWCVAPVGTIWNFHETPSEVLDFKFDPGYGTAEAPSILAWSRSYVIYIHEYDGSQAMRWLPRYPEEFAFPEIEQ
jgi:hypothetical protein